MLKQNIENTLIERASAVKSSVDFKSPPILILSEGDDPRMQEAANKIASIKLGRVLLLAKRKISTVHKNVEVVIPDESRKQSEFVEKYLELRKGKGETRETIAKLMGDPLYFSAMLLGNGSADAAVSGAVNTTADVFRAGIRCLGTSPGINTASSFFLMILNDGRSLTYADCGLLPYPTSEELADIAIAAAQNHKKLTLEIPRVALLSFSTKGSAEHERIDHVRKALAIIKEREPDLIVDGELQFDAAFVPAVAARKAPQSQIQGDANVFVFPNLDAGNIAYKITERIAGAKALGPLLQGLSKPWMDLSRGCTSEDIVLVAAIAALLK